MSVIVFSLFPIFFKSVLCDLSDYIRLEHDSGDLLKPKQPLMASRDGRFIRFDTGESEIELEFGVSVPFAKLPIPGARGGEHHEDHRVALNPAGLLVGATLLLTSFLLVPLVLPAETIPNNHLRKATQNSLEGGRGWGNRLWTEFDEVLTASNLQPRSCSMKAVCVITKHTAIAPVIINYISQFDLVQKMLGPISNESCDEAYPTCSVPSEFLRQIPNYFRSLN